MPQAETRARALADLATLVRDAPDDAGGDDDDDDAVAALLPYWPKIYARASMDPARAVREAAQLAHRSVAERAGKRLAPHLKRLAPAWLLACKDPVRSVASLATAAFQATFPTEQKRAAVIQHCLPELLAVAVARAAVQTRRAVGRPEPRRRPRQDARYEFPVSASLPSRRADAQPYRREERAAVAESSATGHGPAKASQATCTACRPGLRPAPRLPARARVPACCASSWPP